MNNLCKLVANKFQYCRTEEVILLTQSTECYSSSAAAARVAETATQYQQQEQHQTLNRARRLSRNLGCRTAYCDHSRPARRRQHSDSWRLHLHLNPKAFLTQILFDRLQSWCSPWITFSEFSVRLSHWLQDGTDSAQKRFCIAQTEF